MRIKNRAWSGQRKNDLHRTWPRRAVDVALFLVILLCASYTFPRWADPNQNSRLDMVVAVVDDGTLRIDKYVENTVDYARVGDHTYSDKAPGTAFLGIPIYATLRLVLDGPFVGGLMNDLADNDAFAGTLRADGTGIRVDKVRFALAQVAIALVVASFPTAILGLLMYQWLERLTPDVAPRLLVVLGYAVMTPAFAYAGAVYGHQLSASLLFAAFFLLSNQRERYSKLVLLVVGFLLGYSVVTEYPSALIAVLLYIYALYRLSRRGEGWRIGWTTASGGLVALGWMIYNNSVFGGPLELGYGYSELWVDQHSTGFFSLTTPHLDVLWQLTFGAYRGLFLLSPWLLLAVPGTWLWWRSGRHRPEIVISALAVGVTFLFNASSAMWWGGYAIGPRYLLQALPFMALPATPFIVKGMDRLSSRVTVGALFVWSLIVVWFLALAGQAFPPDYLMNPLSEYALPNWLEGDIARNAGTMLGLQGPLSLTPLVAIVLLILLASLLISRRPMAEVAAVSDLRTEVTQVALRVAVDD